MGFQSGLSGLNAAAKNGAGENPQSAGKIAKLRGQHRANERTGPCDRGKVMSKDDPLVGAHEIAAVLEALSGRGAQGVERENAGRDELAVKAVADRVAADRGDHQPHGVDFFSAMQGDGRD